MRSVLIMAHTFRYEVTCMAADAARQLRVAGFDVRMLAGEASEAGCDAEATVVPDDDSAADGAEIVLVFGGDGTFLRAAEYARPAGVPMLGVNFGHVGFLAEADPEAVAATIKAVIDGRYEVEERTTVDVEVSHHGTVLATSWALNEASVEKSKRERVLEVAVAVDERPLLRFGCDGVLCATPTGSTAYAYSVGGPIVWPNVDALLVVPNAAHALFARPIIVSPQSVIDVELLREDHPGVLACDGRRLADIPPQGRVRVRRGALPVRIARIHDWSFGERLVTKFQLPVRSFRDGDDPGVPSTRPTND
ncbi:MAG TPA: NAD kinase [Jatrophihabitantaceae bacterium]|nr:NAD kinase [Jatrophihabitantaceae bacterium]